MFESNWLVGLHLPPEILSAQLLWTANGLFLLVLILAARGKPIQNLLANRPNQHVYFGTMVSLLVFWGIKAGVTPGLGFHHLGATLFTLMFGWSMAIYGLTVVLVFSMLVDPGSTFPQLGALGVNGLLSIVIPVSVSITILRMSQRFLPDNFFIYIFVVAFFGAGVAVASSRLAAIGLLALVGAYPDTTLVQESLLMMPLFMFPEAFVTGMLISVFVVYRPEWVLTFDDARYINGK